MPLSPGAPRRGRPRKFSQPSRPVTLTLPEEVIETLGGLDRDLSRAVVRVTHAEVASRPHPPAELIEFGRRAVIAVHRTPTLEQRTGVVLVPLPDGRALIAFDERMTPARLELAMHDALEGEDLSDEDRGVFESIRDLLRDARRSSTVSMKQQQIMILEFGAPAGVRRSSRDRTRAAGGAG